MIVKRRITWVLLAPIALVCIIAILRLTIPQNDIDEIYVYHGVLGQCFPEYRIDLKNMELWKYTSVVGSEYKPRDVYSEN